LKAVANL